MPLSRKQVVGILRRLREVVLHEPCWTCDCLQGLLTQLELDGEEDVTELTADLKVPRDRMHGCLGCDPCPPGQVYVGYLRSCSCRSRENEECE